MFRFINSIDEKNRIFNLGSEQLISLMELMWHWRLTEGSGDEVGKPYNRSNIDSLSESLITTIISADFGDWLGWGGDKEKYCGKMLWDHLIYAYMIENTRIYDIFRRVLYEYATGEKLKIPSLAAQKWLRNTEELFFRDQSFFFVGSLSSHVRSDMTATRRNAYWRMFGMDLCHGTDDGKPYPYVKADAYNKEFINTFDELLREVWVGISNAANTSGHNPTDNGKIFNTVQNLHNMMIARRMHGNLSREEFSAVCMMSWFHLAVDSNSSPIIESLQAQATSAEQRLFKIAESVRLPAHGLSRNYFDISSALSRVLIFIESRNFKEEEVEGFYKSTVNPMLVSDMRNIITHWSIITGRDVKSRKVSAA